MCTHVHHVPCTPACVHDVRVPKENSLAIWDIHYSRLSMSVYKGGSHFIEKGEKELKRAKKSKKG